MVFTAFVSKKVENRTITDTSGSAGLIRFFLSVEFGLTQLDSLHDLGCYPLCCSRLDTLEERSSCMFL